MFLQSHLNEQGGQVYMLKKSDPMGQQTCSAHPAWFSLDDKYSWYKVTIKKCFKVLMTQQLCPTTTEGPLNFMSLLPPATSQRLYNQTLQSGTQEAFLPALPCGIQSPCDL
uniref:Nucleolar protein 10 n=1 Tax=Prolemur simus TaxID=1328070 RepID=A0A8C8YP24_PROSS